jgi:hypothetical protein
MSMASSKRQDFPKNRSSNAMVQFIGCNAFLLPATVNIWRADSFRPQIDESRCRLRNGPPTCPNCGGVARPNILMFNDWDWIDDMVSNPARTAENMAA